VQYEEPKTYAVKHSDEQTRALSRSGGVFTALSDLILRQGGIVYGCVMNGMTDAVHIRAESVEERDRMRGSKYIQSRTADTFRDVKRDLEKGRIVMYSGTPCQIAGLLSFLGKDYPNLVSVDIICHGVPSPLVWRKYLQWQEEKHGTCVAVDFRNKRDFGWAAHVETMIMEDKEGTRHQVDSSVFKTMFYGHSILRPACYECAYKTLHHPADITIADYWEIDRAAPGFNDNKGVSLVIINNEKGMQHFEQVKSNLIVLETELSKSTRPSMLKPASRPDFRDGFWKDLNTNSFETVAKRYGGYGLKNQIKRKLKFLLKKVKL